MTWYFRRCSAFMQEAGMIPPEVEKLRLTEAAREVFLYKLQRIHQTILRLRQKELERKQNG